MNEEWKASLLKQMEEVEEIRKSGKPISFVDYYRPYSMFYNLTMVDLELELAKLKQNEEKTSNSCSEEVRKG